MKDLTITTNVTGQPSVIYGLAKPTTDHNRVKITTFIFYKEKTVSLL
jgi:hypothetical protein